MKKRMLVFGGDMFVSMKYTAGNYEIKANKLLNKLNEKFELFNFSNKYLTSSKALSYAKTFLNNSEYDECILDLGEADMVYQDIKTFKSNMVEIVNLLLNNGIKPVFVSDSNSNQNEEYVDFISNLAKKYNLNVIRYNGKNDTYIIKTDAQFRKAIFNTCL